MMKKLIAPTLISIFFVWMFKDDFNTAPFTFLIFGIAYIIDNLERNIKKSLIKES